MIEQMTPAEIFAREFAGVFANQVENAPTAAMLVVDSLMAIWLAMPAGNSN